MITRNSSPDQIIREGFAQVSGFAPPGMERLVKDEASKIQTYDDLVNTLNRPLLITEGVAHKGASAIVYGLLEKFGIDPNEWKLTVDPIESGKVKYGPEEYNNAVKFLGSWTKLAEISLFVATLAALATVIGSVTLAGRAVKVLGGILAAGGSVAEFGTAVNLAKFRGIKWLTVPAFIGTLAAAFAFFANTQITATGDLTTYVLQGVARGEEAKQKLQAGGGSSGGSSPDLPRTIIRMTTEEKPKQFLGTLFSSKLGKADHFERALDDRITDMQDLEADVKINLNRWLASLPNRMGYSIVIRKDPVDEFGAQQSGIWATLTLFITHISGKTTPIDTILLGPVEPAVRLELQRRTTSVENQVSGFIQAAQVREIEIPAGSIDIFNTEGERVLPSTVAETPSIPAPTPTPTPSGQASNRLPYIRFDTGELRKTATSSAEVLAKADAGVYTYIPAPSFPTVVQRTDTGSWEAYNAQGVASGLYGSREDAYRSIGQSPTQAPTPTPTPSPTPAPTLSIPPAALSATTLFDFYRAYNMALPSVASRSALYHSAFPGPLTPYTGTAEQNTKLLQYLKANGLGSDVLLGA